jgi:tetrahydromethanopterin S-methyltransferase subunit A
MLQEPELGREPERPWAVRLMHRLDALRTLLTAHPLRRALRRCRGQLDWPVVAGAYVVGDPAAAVAVCTLTDTNLMPAAAALPGVAIAGRVYTANLGLEKIVLNITANPRIRFLLLCGRDSPVFHPGQTLGALCTNGVTPDGRVVGADGYLPVLGNVSLGRIEQFRRQVELVDCTGETDLPVLAARARDLAARSPGLFGEPVASSTPSERFRRIQPGGKREPARLRSKGLLRHHARSPGG